MFFASGCNSSTGLSYVCFITGSTSEFVYAAFVVVGAIIVSVVCCFIVLVVLYAILKFVCLNMLVIVLTAGL